MFKGCQTVTFYANDMTSNWEVWMIWHFKFYVLLANSTMMSSLSQEYENIEPGDYKSVSEKQPRTQENKIEKKIENEDEDVDSDDKIHMENPYGDLNVNNEYIKEISLSNLWKVIVENSRNENDGFKKEYAVCV